MSAILKLWWWQLVNKIKQVFSNPVNLLAACFLVVIAFGYGWVLGAVPFLHTSRNNAPDAPVPPVMVDAGLFLLFCAISSMVVGSGFMDSLLFFTPADFAYLFPAPISSRTILAARLPRILIGGLSMAFWCQTVMLNHVATALHPFANPWITRGIPWQPHYTVHERLLASAIFFCLGGYQNLAGVLEINRRKSRLDGWLYTLLLVGVAAWLWLECKSPVDAAKFPGIRFVFWPCQLASQALVGIVLGLNITRELAGLAVFYVATLGLVFAREVNFTERSLAVGDRLQAARDRVKAGSLFGPDVFRHGAEIQKRVYTIRPFGSGPAALLWANLSAAFKRPWVHIGGPLLLGIGLGSSAFMLPEVAGYTLPQICLYTTIGATWLAQMGFMVGRTRQTLIRPLPFDGWQVTLADLTPAVVMSLLFQWVLGVVLLFVPDVPDRGLPLFEIFACIPAFGVCLMLISYGSSAWTISAQDAGQTLLSMASGPVAMALFTFLTASIMHIPAALHAPSWVPPTTALIFCLIAAPGLLALSGYLYSEFRPEAGVVMRRSKA
ncbi:MAG: putative ABC exporter domain-containing protein [Capsulimonadaceae bacterium]